MKRREFALGLASFIGLAAVPAFAKNRRRNNNRNRNGRNNRNNRNRRPKAPTVKEEEIRFTGTLAVDGDKLSVSGNSNPLEMDKGLISMAKKHSGKEVEVIGKKVTVSGKSKIRVRFIKPVR